MGAFAMDLNMLSAALTVLGLPIGYYIARLAMTEVRHGTKWLEIASKALTAAVLYLLLATMTPPLVALLWAVVFFGVLWPTPVHTLCVISAFLMFFNGLVMGLLAAEVTFVVTASLVFLNCLVYGSLATRHGGWPCILVDGGALLLGIGGSVLGLW
jgi:hypothetical protein